MSISLSELDDDAIDDIASELRHTCYLLIGSEPNQPWVGCGEDAKELYRRMALSVVRALRRHED